MSENPQHEERQRILRELEELKNAPIEAPAPDQSGNTPAEMMRAQAATRAADLVEAIDVAKGADAPPDVPENEYIGAIRNAQIAMHKGTPLDAAVGQFVKKLGARPEAEKLIKERARTINSLIKQLSDAVNAPSVSADERTALLAAFQHPNAEVKMPDTDATRTATDILKRINDEVKEIKAPPSLRRYGKTMVARPVGEVTGSLLEGGLSTLIVSSAIQTAFGVTIAPHSAAHAATYAASAVGWNMGVNMTTKSGILQSVANTGSISKGAANWFLRDKKGRVSPKVIAGRTVRLASIGLLLAGGVAVAQKVLSSNDESDRNSTLIAEPINNQKEKIRDFEARLRAFGPVIPTILEISSRIESGRPPKQGEAAPQAKGPQPANKWVPYTAQEVAQMKKNELEPLFLTAGLDLELLKELKFSDPKDTGQGPVFEFKRALRTGDTSKLRDLKAEDFAKLKTQFPGDEKDVVGMVNRIRRDAGLTQGQTFEQKTTELINTFLKSEELSKVQANLDEALRIGGVIRAQGSSVGKTFRSAFLEGTPPLGINAVLPYVTPIAQQKDQLLEQAKKSISLPIANSLTTLSKALGALGGSVDTPKLPDWQLDVEPALRLTATIEKITSQATSNALAEQEAKSTWSGMLDAFIPGLPGSAKAAGSERYVAKTLLGFRGYKVVTKGEQTYIYERTGNDVKAGYSVSGADAWNTYLFGRDARQNAEKTFPAELDLQKATSLSNTQLGELMLPHIQALATLTAQNKTSQPNNTDLARMSAQYERMSTLNKEELGRLVRAQIGVQFGVQRVPILYAPEVWLKMTSGEAPPISAQDSTKWAELVLKADPTFSQQLVGRLSAINDKELGSAANDHIRKIVDYLEKNQGEEYMLRQYRAMLVTGNSDARLLELGVLSRKQLAQQIERQMNPPTIYPANVWAGILDPSLTEVTNESIDPAIWKQLPEEQANKLFATYLKAAQLEAFAGLSLTVSLLSLGTFAASITAVRSRNRNLLKAKDKFAENWRDIERDVVDRLDQLNTALKKMPFFSSLPPMEPYMMLAALRKLGEEYEEDVREDLTLFEKMKVELKNALSKGPYAETILEIFAQEKLFERLQNDPKAMRKLQDIIAPGLAEVAGLTEKLAVDDPKKTPMENLLITMQSLDLDGKELMRDAARGHLRFRQEVSKARMTLNERSQAALTKSEPFKSIRDKTGGNISLSDIQGDTLSSAELATLQQLSDITAESIRFDDMEVSYANMIERLDTDAMAEEMLQRYRPARPFTRRAQRASRADEAVSIEIPTEGTPLKEFSLVSGLARDEKKIIDDADSSGNRFKEACAMLERATSATRERYQSEHPGRTLSLLVEVTPQGDTALNAIISENGNEISRREIPGGVLSQAQYQPYSAAEKLDKALRAIS